jgi:DNA-binding response OmpR family regulator
MSGLATPVASMAADAMVWMPALRLRSGHLPADRFSGSSGPNRVRVLLVEDDALIADMYRRRLELDGYDVSIARDGAAGLEALRSGRFDIALVDIRLPAMDGLQVLEETRRHGVQTPVVMITNYSAQETRRKSLELGALDYVVKSRVLPDWLSEQIPSWLRAHGPRRAD